MKKSICTFILSIFGQFLFAASVWFSPYPAGFNVNLADSESYQGTDGTWNIANHYDDNTLIGVVGITDAYADEVYLEIEMDFPGEQWCYVSASEPYLKRPFGIVFVTSNGDNQRKVYHKGYSSTGSIVLDADGQNIAQIPLELDSDGDAWCDLVLYLPSSDIVDLSSALSADDYYCSFSIKIYVNGREEKKWTYSFNGYIGEEPQDDTAHVFFNILPYASANAINVYDLLDESQEILIGEYSYETQSFIEDRQDEPIGGYENYVSNRDVYNKFHIFASSSEDPTDTGGYFTLVLRGYEYDSSVGVDDSYSLRYEVGLGDLNSNRIQWYTGTESLDTISSELAFNNNDQGYRLETMRDDQHSIVFFDEGYIYIRAPENNTKKAENLTPGVYSSRIYLHVISDY